MQSGRKPDREQMQRFVRALFKHAAPGNWVSLRSFIEDRDDVPPFKITTVKLNGNLDILIDKACRDAALAADAHAKIVFAPPIATFTNNEHAREIDLAEGLALSTECDTNAQAARARLEQLLGPATAVVQSGGEWVDPDTGELKPKLHTHHRLTTPARDASALAKLKLARKLAAEIVGGDPSNAPTVHPIRWPGSWHRKNKPTICRIVELTDNEIDLDAALKALQQAAEPTANFFESIDEVTHVPQTPAQEVNALALTNTGWFKKFWRLGPWRPTRQSGRTHRDRSGHGMEARGIRGGVRMAEQGSRLRRRAADARRHPVGFVGTSPAAGISARAAARRDRTLRGHGGKIDGRGRKRFGDGRACRLRRNDPRRHQDQGQATLGRLERGGKAVGRIDRWRLRDEVAHHAAGYQTSEIYRKRLGKSSPAIFDRTKHCPPTNARTQRGRD